MARDILAITERELKKLVSIELEIVDVIENVFARLSAGDVVMPPILSMEIPAANGEVDVKTAYIPGLENFAIKISPGFFDNPKLGLPSLNGLMVLLSARTGLVDALLLDQGYLTDIRTAAAGAVAARHLAPPVTTAGVLGTGVQARLQMRAARLVRPFERVLVWGRDSAKAAACARSLGEELEIDARAEADPARLLAECELVVTATPARSPILLAEWLHPRLHITAMGSDQPGKNEIDARVFRRLDAYVPDRLSQCRALGELRAALAAGLVGEEKIFVELGEIVRTPSLGRASPEDITLCDLTGTGAQDTAIATYAYQRAKRSSAGSIIQA